MDYKSTKINAIISACLIGINCRYNGKNSFSEYINIYRKNYNLIPICPEQLGGLPTPREPAQIIQGDGFDVLAGKTKVLTISGRDITDNFIKGAEEVLKVCKLCYIKYAFLKEKSPSCGVNKIYNSGKLVRGSGITTSLLIKNNIEVFGVD